MFIVVSTIHRERERMCIVPKVALGTILHHYYFNNVIVTSYWVVPKCAFYFMIIITNTA